MMINMMINISNMMINKKIMGKNSNDDQRQTKPCLRAKVAIESNGAGDVHNSAVAVGLLGTAHWKIQQKPLGFFSVTVCQLEHHHV